MVQPWVADIDMLFAGGAFAIPKVGVFGVGITQLDYGEMDVTTLDYQDGTGEKFKATDMAATLTFSRKIVSWFSFGTSAKYISSNIWHSSASAFAIDLGVLVNTKFFSFTGKDKDGMNIGMSISNYGTRMKYDGIDLLNPIDISPFEDGNFADVAGQFRPQGWELPLLFRIGVGIKPLYTNLHRMLIAVDAVHPNNNSEYINVGAQYELRMAGQGSLYLRSGYKSLFMKDSQFGPTYGGGIKINLMNNQALQLDYSRRTAGLLGDQCLYA